jgi:DNA helicase-2/ATP-dependent DNA helicase PcrA
LDLLDRLNPEQRAAVEHPGGAVLVVAGAGSGKTRVLTARVARLLAHGVPPRGVLAFTFTNRAAREMRARIEAVVGEAARELWVGTFHGTCVRLLRREAEAAGVPSTFAIYDRDDQEGVLRGLIRRLGLPEAEFRIGAVLGRISDAKNALVTPAEFERVAASPHERRVADLFARYQGELRRSGALDFDDLIGEAVRLLRDRPDVAERWGRRFHHVLVDEYQDTNHAQFRLVHTLSAVHGNVFVVGDDDQSIYGWRGADLSNVLDFERAFPGAAVLRLEQNYRSTANILRAANAVIEHNRARKGKTLWCEREDGVRLRFALASDESDEAVRVRHFLDERRRRGARLDGAAVLYRTNAQSRALETELRQHGVAYEVVGGVSFYQRREVKDLLAYLRLVVNPHDTAAFWRIWNTPRRGLGPALRAQVEALMAARSLGPVEALRALRSEGSLTRRGAQGAAGLLAVLDELRAHVGEPVDALCMRLLQGTGYLRHLESSGEEDEADRRANVEELVAAAGAYAAARAAGRDPSSPLEEPGQPDEARGGAPTQDGSGSATLVDFLTETALLTDADRLAEGVDRVLLLTAHNAKGLEFDAVVVAGLEEGLFPHASSLDDEAELEEERRLFYVAVTRARDEVLLTAAALRRRFGALGGMGGGQVSRFVDEIPASLIEHEDGGAPLWRGREKGDWIERGTVAHASRAGRAPRGGAGAGGAAGSSWASSGHVARRGEAARRAVGREVYHEKFGRGIVVDAEGDGADLKCTVRFIVGTKKVLARFLAGGGDADPA